MDATESTTIDAQTLSSPQGTQDPFIVQRAKRAYSKPTQAEHDERVNYVADMLANGDSKSFIVKTIKEKWDVSTRTVEQYLSRARNRMADESMEPKGVHRMRALAVYQQIIDDPLTAPRDKIKAQDSIVHMLGLAIHDARRVEVSGPGGGPIQSQSTVLTVDVSSKLLEYAQSIRAAALANLQERLALSAPIPADQSPQ